MDMQVKHFDAATPVETAIGEAIRTILAILPENTEMLFYRDEDTAATLELTHPDGRVEIAIATPTTGDFIIEPAEPAGATITTWRQVDIEAPELLTDVLLWQVLPNFSVEEGNTLMRIGFRHPDGRYIDSYASTLTGDDEVLQGITHWAPFPNGPLMATEAP